MSTTRAQRPTRSRPTTQRPARSNAPGTPRPAVAVVPVKQLFTAEHSNYFLLLGTTLFLVIFGLVMVLSSSSIESYNNNAGFFGRFVRQGLFAVVGIPLMLVASRMPATFWKRLAWPALGVGAALQLLVFTPLGFESGGNRNWILIGDYSFQPSEFVKVALILWMAWILSSKQHLLSDWKHVALPIVPVVLAALGFVLVGKDLGTAAIMVMFVMGCLYFAGVRIKFLAVALVAISVLGFIFSKLGSSRVDRINAWLYGCPPNDPLDICWQPQHAVWALAGGGLFGRGLGNSTAKWNWLPEASSDYIFAIIGEELGLIGAVVVLVLFIVLAIAFVRVIRATRDPFARIVTSGVMVWVVGQALVNIAVVLGVLPVLGVPLPLISAGGSALIATLLGIGIVLSFARTGGATPGEETLEQSPAERSRLLAAQRAATRPAPSRPVAVQRLRSRG